MVISLCAECRSVLNECYSGVVDLTLTISPYKVYRLECEPLIRQATLRHSLVASAGYCSSLIIRWRAFINTDARTQFNGKFPLETFRRSDRKRSEREKSDRNGKVAQSDHTDRLPIDHSNHLRNSLSFSILKRRSIWTEKKAFCSVWHSELHHG